ncbi:Apc15p protein-domain-containing protein [Xylaria sp. FL1777]|nr:Apc15p protein-domain-containing protein [Xylaria sp. FL1777]
MFALLPDLSPRDSHSLWYTSSRNPLSSSNTQDARLSSPHQEHIHGHGHPHGPNSNHRRGAQLIERSPLARLRADEQNLERRQHNVTNFGSAWLKPPGLPKTLHQLREERREAEEHQEALRREQLAQELAEAEAEAAGAAADGDAGAGAMIAGGDLDVMLDAPPDGDDGMDDVQLDGARDLDDEIPEADEADFGLSDNDDEDDDDEEDEDESDEDDEDEDDDDDEDADEREMHAAHAQQQQLMAQRMRQANDAFREDMARGRDSAAFYGVDEDIDDEDQSQMIEEDDLVGAHGDDGMGMDADLDDEIPDAESMGGYEHTDTEAELSSSVGGDDDNNNNSRMSFVAPQQANRIRHSLARSDATRNSLAISDILSRDGSSVLSSSPAVPRQPRAGLSSRRGRG